MANILFHNEDIEFTLHNHLKVSSWIEKIISLNNASVEEINYIFCSDEYLLNINTQYLNHNYFTDIITFDHSDQKLNLESDIFISLERVKENAQTLNTVFDDELHRVMIHGVLHLLGTNDKTKAEKEEMRKIEDHYLALREF